MDVRKTEIRFGFGF